MSKEEIAEFMLAVAARIVASVSQYPNGNTRDALREVAHAIRETVQQWQLDDEAK